MRACGRACSTTGLRVRFEGELRPRGASLTGAQAGQMGSLIPPVGGSVAGLRGKEATGEGMAPAGVGAPHSPGPLGRTGHRHHHHQPASARPLSGRSLVTQAPLGLGCTAPSHCLPLIPKGTNQRPRYWKGRSARRIFCDVPAPPSGEKGERSLRGPANQQRSLRGDGRAWPLVSPAPSRG